MIFHKIQGSIQRVIHRGVIEHETSTVKTKFEYNVGFAQRKTEFPDIFI